MARKKKHLRQKKEVVTCSKYKWQHLFLYGFRLEDKKCPICNKQPEYNDRDRMFIDLGFGFIFASLFVTLPYIFDAFGILLGNLGAFIIILALVLSIRYFFNNSWPTIKKKR
ncbi:hypothetical protein [Flammeovirga sp. SubArs3]|uniref:hypothetical protein n=1 Tax=Flammeovirga sp. SubArs3 TaxID=2995316 RepID=UPI00248CB70E|nr:hypothetical protein [Flammeovirga sp. SubArs3]